MKRIPQKVISLFTVFVLTVAMAVPSFASETGNSTEVTSTVASRYTITIPKKITLDGGGTTAQPYTVTVSGDISGRHAVRVHTPDTITLTQTGKDPVTVDTAFDSTWDYEAMASGTSIEGSVALASGTVLQAGKYSGSLPFDIEEIEYAPEASYTVTPTVLTNLSYTGAPLEIISAGSSDTGTIEYSLDGIIYSETLPKIENAGDYTIWYRIIGDSHHMDTEPVSVSVHIEKGDGVRVGKY